MPHFGLMDEHTLGPEGAALQRARLHIRGGRRRLVQGKVSLGILTMYDALVSALQWYVISPERRKKLQIAEGDDLSDDKAVYDLLVRSAVLDNAFDYSAFNELVEQALRKELSGYNYEEMVKKIEAVMTRLGVMPFDESRLPPEDPSTV